ncbi:PAS domain-containing protein [Streptacidiphilus cavernicola]|uniref:PAS domain-containing protein n=1 Tax=Streptacidiphilus cavernicola TaxID=3342716 RepID=A0ABV6VW29_9ACTN
MSSRPTRGTARLAAILDALPDALLLVNSNGTVVDANAAAVRSLQAPGTSLVGMGVLDLLPEFDPSRIPGSMRPRARAEDGSEEDDDAPVRMTARRTDGTSFPVEVAGNEFEDDGLLGGGLGGLGSGSGSSSGGSARPGGTSGGRDGYGPYDSYGGVSRYGYGASGGSGAGSSRPSDRELLLIVVRDLSARLEVEAELRRQHKQTEMILRAAAEGVLGVDIEGRVVLVNPAAAHILGFRASELGGQELLPLVQHSKADGTPQSPEESPLADTLASGRKHRVRTAVLWRKDGRPVHVELSTAPVRDGEQLVGAVMTFTDRTAFLSLEARHEHLTAVLREELDEPLGRLQGTLERLAADPAGQLWPEANWVLRRLAADCARTARLVDGVLSYQRFDASLDAGREALERHPVGLDAVVRRAVAAATELIGEDRVRFAVHPSEVEVIVDQERLAQALGHLIADVALPAAAGSGVGGGGSSEGGNGLYGMAVGVASGLSGTPGQGPTVVIAAAQRGPVARIEVRGPSAGGSPVHLPIARGMVERHGGVLQSHELPGKQGRTYVVELPLDPATAGEAAERAAAAARRADRTRENDTAMLPELPGLGTPAGGGGGAGAAGGGRGTGDGSATGGGAGARAGGSTAGGGRTAGGMADGGTGGGTAGGPTGGGYDGYDGASDGLGTSAGGASLPGARRSAESLPEARPETPAQGTDRSRRRRALPAPEVVRPPRAVLEAQQQAEAQAEEQAQQRQEQQPVQQQPGLGTNGFPGLIGGPVYPGLEHALPPAGSRIDPAPVPAQADAAPSNGRRRRLAIPPGDDQAQGGSGGPLALEPPGGSTGPQSGTGPQSNGGSAPGGGIALPGQQSHAPEQGSGPSALQPAALQPVPAAAPFGGRFGPDGGGNSANSSNTNNGMNGSSGNGPGGNGTGTAKVRALGAVRDVFALGPASAPAAPREQTAAQSAAPAAPSAAPPGDDGPGTESRLEFIAGADYPTMVSPAADGRPRRLLVWPDPDPSTRQALQDRGYRPVIVRTREEVEGQVAGFPAALFVDPLTGPITRTALQTLRTAAGDANVPVLVTAGLGQATREAAYGADPAVLLRALAPRDSERHAPRVLLVEQDQDIAAAFTATLERRGMHVVHALSENDAVEKAGSVQPNLVVMDLMLIRRRRVGIVDWLRDNNQLHRTPLVIYTSVDGPQQNSRLRAGETVLFLAERSTSPEVQARIVDLLGKIGSLGG